MSSETVGTLQTIFDYDTAGRIKTSNVSGYGTDSYDYYPDGTLESVTTPDNKTISYTYYRDGSVENMTDYFGGVTSYAYNAMGQITNVSSSQAGAVYTYTDTGMVETITYPSNATVEYTYYDNYDRIETQTNKKANGDVINAYEYTYDALGNQLTKEDYDGQTTSTTYYSYDDLSRLNKVTEPGGRITAYTFDNMSNISQKNITHPSSEGVMSDTVLYAYDAKNQLTESRNITITAGGIAEELSKYSYDAKGNNLNKTSYGQGAKTVVSYGYDDLGRMTSYNKQENGTQTVSAQYGYNASGLRTSKTVNNAATKYYLHGDVVINESKGTNLASNIIGNGVIARTFSDETGASYLMPNGHGDVTSIVKGGVVSDDLKFDYDAYGVPKQAMSDRYPVGYFGQYHDAESGLVYLRARYYDPAMGRFVSEDPAMDGDNWYMYCAGNPVNLIDLSGKGALQVVDSLSQSSVGQQILAQLEQLAAQAGVTLQVFVANNLPMVQQMIDKAGNIIPAVWDWTTGTAAPWAAEKAQKLFEVIGDSANKAGSWIKDKWNNATNGDPNKKPSLNKVSNSDANKIAQKNGFKNAEDFKESIVGKDNISKFNMKVDKKTGEIFLESVNKGGAQIETGYYK